jgi:hypothetical protein
MPQYVPLSATLCRTPLHFAALCRTMPHFAALCRNLPQFATLVCTDSHYHPINILLLLVSHNYITIYI